MNETWQKNSLALVVDGSLSAGRSVDASGGYAGTNLEINAHLEKDGSDRGEEGAQNISTVKYQQNRSRESRI